MLRALVTGGNRGIGLAIAKGLVERGIDVTIGARDRSAGASAAVQIGASPVELDVADVMSIARAVDEVGPFDILVNNAGVLHKGPVLSNPEQFDEAISVMLRGPYELIRRCVPYMEAKGHGRIVNVSSDWGAFSEGLEGPGAYGVAKAALNALTFVLSRQLPPGVKINAMCPGWVRTRMGGMGANRTPEEGADTALWLATLAADGPTGGFFRDRRPLAW